MSLASCKKCKRLFQKIRSSICPVCETAEEGDYETVRTYLSANPGKNAEQVSEGTGVSLDAVLRFIEEGRVETQSALSHVACGQCGAPAISPTKRLCQSCLEKLNAQMAQQQSRIKLPEKKRIDIGKELNTFRVPMKGGGVPDGLGT